MHLNAPTAAWWPTTYVVLLGLLGLLPGQSKAKPRTRSAAAFSGGVLRWQPSSLLLPPPAAPSDWLANETSACGLDLFRGC